MADTVTTVKEEVEIGLEDMECDVCGQNHVTEECPMLGLSTSDFKAQISRARLTVPHYLGVIDYTNGEIGIMAMEPISNKTQLGPFEAKKTCVCPLDDVFILKILSADGNTICLDTSSENQCNWMALVQVARSLEEQNCMAYQLGINIYFSTTRDVPPGTPLRVWYASKYAQKLGKPTVPDGKTRSMLRMDVSEWSQMSPEGVTVQSCGSDTGLIEAASYLSSILPSSSLSSLSSASDQQHHTTIIMKDEASASSSADSQQVYSCSKCSQVFLSQNDYAIHLRGHLMPASLLSHSGRTGRRGRPWGRAGVVTPLGKRGPGRPRKTPAPEVEPGEVLSSTTVTKLAASRPYKRRGRPPRNPRPPPSSASTQGALEQSGDGEREGEGEDGGGDDGNGKSLEPGEEKMSGDGGGDGEESSEVKSSVEGGKEGGGKEEGSKDQAAAADSVPPSSSSSLSSSAAAAASATAAAGMDISQLPGASTTTTTTTTTNSTTTTDTTTAITAKEQVAKKDDDKAHIDTTTAASDLQNVLTPQQQQPNNPPVFQPAVKMPKRRGRPPKNLAKITATGEVNQSPAKVPLQHLSSTSSRRVQPRRTLKGKRTSTFKYPGESSSDEDDDHDSNKTKGKNILKQALRVKEYSDDDDIVDDDEEDGGLEPGEVVVMGRRGEDGDVDGDGGSGGGVEITVQTPDGVILSKTPVILLQGDGTGHGGTVTQDMLSLVTSGMDISGQQVVLLQSAPSSTTATTTTVTCDPDQGDTTTASTSLITSDLQQGEADGATITVTTDPEQRDTTTTLAISEQGEITMTTTTATQQQGEISIPEGEAFSTTTTTTTTSAAVMSSVTSGEATVLGGDDGGQSQDALATLVNAALSSHSLVATDRDDDVLQTTGDEDHGGDDDMTSDDPDWRGPTAVKREGGPLRKRRGKRRKGDDPSLEMLEETIQVVQRPDGSQEFACGVCMKRFQQLKYLKMHLPAHTDKFLCNDCGRRFARHESLQKHVCEDWLVLVEKIKSEEDGSLAFRCKECGRSFPQMDHARRHASMHRGTWACAKCQHTFPKRQLLLEHKCAPQLSDEAATDTTTATYTAAAVGVDESSNTHEGEGNMSGEEGVEGEGEFPCDICQQRFMSAKYLFRHMAMHTELFKCASCGKCYSRKDSLQRHVLKCCPELADNYSVFSCDKCKKTFGTRLGLENHMLNCGKFQCAECRIAFFSEEDLNTHRCEGRVIDDTTGVQFPCKECGKTFASLPYLSRHEASHHAAFECPVCKKVFVRGEELGWHQPVCEGTVQIEQHGVTSCGVCQSQFADVRQFRDHFQMHTHPYRCDKCGKRFIKVGTLHTHKCDNAVSSTTGADGEGVCQCDICEKTFKNERYLARHKQLHGVPSFDCEYCGKKFIRKDYLSDHKCVLPDGTPVRVVRKKNRLYIRDDLVCPHCSKTFSSRSNLNKHMRVHGDKEAECHICGKRFHYHSYLKLHIATVHDRQFQYQCSHCGKILFSKTGLIAHIKQFHQDTVKLFACPKCGKTFRQKGNMRTHMYSHTKERTFKCELCNKSFKYPDQLNRHRLEHTLSEKIKCQYCDKRYVRASELRQHERLFHSGVIYTCHVCHESCAHKHTIVRHYRRKHPEVADIFDRQPEFLDSLQKEVDKVTSLPAQPRMAIQLAAPSGRPQGNHKPRIIRVLNDGGEEQEYIITTSTPTIQHHDDATTMASSATHSAGGGMVQVGEGEVVGEMLPFGAGQEVSHVLSEETVQVLQDMSGAVYETDASGVITQTVEDADGNQTVIILQVVNQDELGAQVVGEGEEVTHLDGTDLSGDIQVHHHHHQGALGTIQVPMEITGAHHHHHHHQGMGTGEGEEEETETITYTTTTTTANAGDVDTAQTMESVIISGADIDTADDGTITLVTSTGHHHHLTSVETSESSVVAMETSGVAMETTTEDVVEGLEGCPSQVVTSVVEGGEQIVHYI